MKKHFKYLKYVLKHKWYVFKASPGFCALIHDFSKFLPSEWFPYVNFFYGDYPSIQEVLGDAKNHVKRFKEDVKEEFDYAWLHHQKRNKHHWQYWVLLLDAGKIQVLKMPEKYVHEMIADWRGAGKAITGEDNILTWYHGNRDKMILHPETRLLVEELLDYKNNNG